MAQCAPDESGRKNRKGRIPSIIGSIGVITDENKEEWGDGQQTSNRAGRVQRFNEKTPADRVTLWTARLALQQHVFQYGSRVNSTSYCCHRAASLPCPTEIRSLPLSVPMVILRRRLAIATVCFCRWRCLYPAVFAAALLCRKRYSLCCCVDLRFLYSSHIRRSPCKMPAFCATAEAVTVNVWRST